MAPPGCISSSSQSPLREQPPIQENVLLGQKISLERLRDATKHQTSCVLIQPPPFDPMPHKTEVNLQLDAVTGEHVSKSELKKRQKQRLKEEEKVKKAAEASTSSPEVKEKASNAEADEKLLNPNQYYEIRSRAIAKLAASNDPIDNPYPHKFVVNYQLENFVKDYGYLKSGEQKKDVEIRVGARIYNKRTSGSKLVFYDVRTSGVKVQIMCQLQEVAPGAPAFAAQHEKLRRGDVIGIIGYPGRTSPKNKIDKGQEGELSILATQVVLLSPCLHQLPDEYYGFKDQESRFRNRHLDFIMNPAAVQAVLTRSRMTKYIRNYLEADNFIDVETPILQHTAGGASARPFMTHHNDLNAELSLRIAPELDLKKLLVGGFNRVFEIGKVFRNEGMDLTHNPEFTTCEFYEAYADCYDLMDRTEGMISGMVKEITGSLTTKFTTQHGEEHEINWAAPWRRVEIIPELERVTGMKFPPSSELASSESNKFLLGVLEKMNVVCAAPHTNARLLDKLISEFIESTCINPTFVMNHPMLMSPLAKYHRIDHSLTERFELFVAKKELVNAYTELNDPFEQLDRFLEQAKQKAQGDDEAQEVDMGYIEAIEHGLMPCAGWGMGLDRMAMFLTNNYNIREVLTYPMMRRERPGN